MPTTVTDRFSGTPASSPADRFSGTPSVQDVYRLPHSLLLSGDMQTGLDAMTLSGDAQAATTDVLLLSGSSERAASSGTTVSNRY